MGDWRESAYSDANGGSCSEAVSGSDLILVGGTDNRSNAMLIFIASAWTVFTAALRLTMSR